MRQELSREQVLRCLAGLSFSVKSRLDGDGMSFTEFSYQLLQG